MMSAKIWVHGLAGAALGIAASTVLAAGGAGTVLYAYGDVAVSDGKGGTRSLRKGDPVYTGDTLQTREGRTQVRFTDGGLAALRANTQYRIAEYRYEGKADGSESGFFDLVRGGVRFVTGAIGHAHRDKFRIKTSVATIGIRGTAGNVEHEGDITNVDGYEGYLGIAAGGKQYDAGTGDSYSCDPNGCTHEQVAGAEPVFGLPGPGNDYIEGEQSDPEGVACDAGGDCAGGQVAPAGAIVKYAFSHLVEGEFVEAEVNGLEADGTPDNQIQLDAGSVIGLHQLDEFFPCEAPGCTFDATGAMLTDTGSHTELGVEWGRWEGPWSYINQFGPVEGVGSFHYAYSDNVTPEAEVLSANGYIVYMLDGGGTQPTLNASPEQAGTLNQVYLTLEFAPEFYVNSFFMEGTIGDAEFHAFYFGDQQVPIEDRYIPLSGSCSGGACGEGMSLYGQSFYNFAGPLVDDCCGGKGPAGVFGSYALNGFFFGDGDGFEALQQDVSGGLSITGTYVLPICPDCSD
jgi:hypothetical protein